jgi:MerR family transcriptional regulator/heat shock protein HspR
MNLAGVERVFELEEEIDRMRRRMRNLERHAAAVQQELERSSSACAARFKFELVPYEPPSQALMPRAERARRADSRAAPAGG